MIDCVKPLELASVVVATRHSTTHQVVNMIRFLISRYGDSITPQSIGIVTPYNGQVRLYLQQDWVELSPWPCCKRLASSRTVVSLGDWQLRACI